MRLNHGKPLIVVLGLVREPIDVAWCYQVSQEILFLRRETGHQEDRSNRMVSELEAQNQLQSIVSYFARQGTAGTPLFRPRAKLQGPVSCAAGTRAVRVFGVRPHIPLLQDTLGGIA